MNTTCYRKAMIIDFMESHGDLDLTNPKDCKLWEELASKLNWNKKKGKHLKLTMKHWDHFWKAMKSDVRKKVEDHIAQNNKTNAKTLQLGPFQRRIAKILGIYNPTIMDSCLKKAIPLTAEAYYCGLYLENAKGNFFKAQREAIASWRGLPDKIKENIILKHKQARNLRRQKIADYLSAVDLNLSPPPARPDSTTSQRNEADVQVDDGHFNESETDEEVANSQETQLCTSNISTSDNLGESTQQIDASIEDNNSTTSQRNEADVQVDDGHINESETDEEVANSQETQICTSNISTSDNLGESTQKDNNSSRDSICRNDEIEPPPPPPVVTTAEELYDLIQKSHDIEQIPWNSLPETEKRQFRVAIVRLKKDYLRQYRAYLHNLSSIDLHKHMVRTLLNDMA